MKSTAKKSRLYREENCCENNLSMITLSTCRPEKIVIGAFYEPMKKQDI